MLKTNCSCPPTYGAMISVRQLPHFSSREYSYAHTGKQHRRT